MTVAIILSELQKVRDELDHVRDLLDPHTSRCQPYLVDDDSVDEIEVDEEDSDAT